MAKLQYDTYPPGALSEPLSVGMRSVVPTALSIQALSLVGSAISQATAGVAVAYADHRLDARNRFTAVALRDHVQGIAVSPLATGGPR